MEPYRVTFHNLTTYPASLAEIVGKAFVVESVSTVPASHTGGLYQAEVVLMSINDYEKILYKGVDDYAKRRKIMRKASKPKSKRKISAKKKKR